MQILHYGELPTRIRMMIMLLALVMVSEFMRIFSLTVFAMLGGVSGPRCDSYAYRNFLWRALVAQETDRCCSARRRACHGNGPAG